MYTTLHLQLHTHYQPGLYLLFGFLTSCILSLTDSVAKTPQASLPHRTASGAAEQSHTVEEMEKNTEAIGDRWDDEEDWGSLEVGHRIIALDQWLSTCGQ